MGGVIHLAGRDFLHDDEYHISDWRYSNYNRIKFLRDNGEWQGWVTPFDVKKEVRIEDFLDFKRQIKEIYYRFGEGAAAACILQNPAMYKKEKRLHTVHELAGVTIPELRCC